MSLININESELYPTESFGPAVEGTLIYNVQGQAEWEGAFITTNERLIMNVNMNGEAYRRVFDYKNIKDVYKDEHGLFIEFPEGMGKIALVHTKTGNEETFVEYVKKKLG
ncbi:hypothetical protein [Nosocomiicoccus massiliensis]|uniref:hypothetical protein n=1 Tax=Nosocomiicoccus massiliensis TaxID=1232430 RepID=UPI0004245F75|nr:hypothetical protein [Nosocomiicoccus massiliensis]